MTDKEMLEYIITHNGDCEDLDCNICMLQYICDIYIGDSYDKWLTIKKESATKKYIELYGKESLMEVLL